MKLTSVLLASAIGLASVTANAGEGGVPRNNFGDLDHVFFIIMENQTNTDILGNSNAPFINAYAKIANQATNYFAVGHPSAPNYLEIVGGSNFGLTGDFFPNWVNAGCTDNGSATGCNGAFTPIEVSGFDNAVVATATNSNQCNAQVTVPPGQAVPNNCALRDYPSTFFTPKSIADQLVAKHKTWKTYQESLPIVVPGVLGVNYSDGAFSNLSPAAVFVPGAIQKLYAVKHDPFAYFADIELGEDDQLSLAQVVDFDGPDGLWVDLQSDAPNFSFIVPNQCHDMHGFVSGGTFICSSNTTAETNLLMQQGDAEVAKIVNGIHASKAWQKGRNAIVLVWDENDYSNAANRVVMLVETNYAPNGRKSSVAYDHFSLLRTLEAGFDLPCLNHACDATSLVMNDMFGAR
jgi:hypothetical protein